MKYQEVGIGPRRVEIRITEAHREALRKWKDPQDFNEAMESVAMDEMSDRMAWEMAEQFERRVLATIFNLNSFL